MRTKNSFLGIFFALSFFIISCGGSEEKLTDPQIDATIGAELSHYWNLSQAVFSPDGKQVASSAYDQSVIIWDVATKHQQMVFAPKSNSEKTGNYLSLAYSTDGKTLVGGTDKGKLVFFDLEKKTIAKSVDVKQYNGKTLALSSDGKLIAIGTDKSIGLYDATSGGLTQTLEGHTRGIKDLVFSNDNKLLASASWDSTARIWDLEAMAETKKIEAEKAIDNVDFNPAGDKLLVNVNDLEKVFIWEVTGSKSKLTIEKYAETALFKGEDIITQNMAKTQIWSAETGEELKSISNGGYNLKLSADNNFAINPSGQGIEIADLNSGEITEPFGKDVRYVSRVHFSPSGRFIVSENSHKSSSGGPDILSFAVDTSFGFSAYGTSGSGANILDFKGNSDVVFAEELYGTQKYYDLAAGKTVSKLENKLTDPFCITSDGKLLTAKEKSGNQYAIFDAATGEKKTDLVDTKAYHYFSGITPDDKYFVMLTMDFFKVWELPSGKEVKSYERKDMDGAIFVDINAEGKHVVGRVDSDDFMLCDLLSGEVLFIAENISAKFAALSPDKNQVAVACSDWDIKVFDIKQNKQTKTLKGHKGIAVAVCYSPNGKYIVSSAQDNQMKVWDSATGKELLTILGLEKMGDYEGETKDFVVYAPNGRYDGTEAGIKQFLYMQKGDARLPVDEYKDKCYTPNLLGRTLGQSFIELTKEE